MRTSWWLKHDYSEKLSMFLKLGSDILDIGIILPSYQISIFGSTGLYYRINKTRRVNVRVCWLKVSIFFTVMEIMYIYCNEVLVVKR